MRVWVLGCARPTGGANVEVGETMLLWRKAGIHVHCIPTWKEAPTNPWPNMLKAAGVRMVSSGQGSLEYVPGLAGATVVAFANHNSVLAWPTLRRMGCKFIHVPCMTAPHPCEHEVFHRNPPSAVIFQSQFQRRELETQYLLWGVPHDRQFLIHGAFDASLHPTRELRARAESEENTSRQFGATHGAFRVGRLARPSPEKWSPDLWPILQKVRDRGVPLEAQCMAWSPAISAKCGAPPTWAVGLAQESMTADAFLAGLDTLLCSGDTDENWPRVVLEAFSIGIPVVAEARGGYLEMIEDETTGLLCGSPGAFVEALARLAGDEPLRRRLSANARASLSTLANPEQIGNRWKEVFSAVARENPGKVLVTEGASR